METAAAHRDYSEKKVLFLALELSNSKWTLGSTVGVGSKARERTIAASDLEALHKEVCRAKRRSGLESSVRVVSCYEAGRDGFWLDRHLRHAGIENIVVDPSSIEVNRRRRRAKTDRLDVGKLLRQLMRWWSGEPKVWGGACPLPRAAARGAPTFLTASLRHCVTAHRRSTAQRSPLSDGG